MRNALVSQGEIFLFVAGNCKLPGCDEALMQKRKHDVADENTSTQREGRNKEETLASKGKFQIFKRGSDFSGDNWGGRKSFSVSLQNSRGVLSNFFRCVNVVGWMEKIWGSSGGFQF